MGIVAERQPRHDFRRRYVRQIVEAPLVGGRFGYDDLAHFLREHRCQAGFIRKHVEQTAADYDCVAD